MMRHYKTEFTRVVSVEFMAPRGGLDLDEDYVEPITMFQPHLDAIEEDAPGSYRMYEVAPRDLHDAMAAAQEPKREKSISKEQDQNENIKLGNLHKGRRPPPFIVGG